MHAWSMNTWKGTGIRALQPLSVLLTAALRTQAHLLLLPQDLHLPLHTEQ